jgi:uncharacterized protein YraI
MRTDRWRVGLGTLLVAGIVLAGCNLSRSSEDEQPLRPTLGTPIAWATAYAFTVTPEATAIRETTMIPQATAAAILEVTPAPSLTPPPTLAAQASPAPFSPTIAPTLTSTPFELLTPTIAPTLTSTPFVFPSATGAPTLTSVPVVTYAPPPTFTPVINQTNTPVPTEIPPTAIPGGQVCATCGQLRLRDAPGTAGGILTTLAANTPLAIIGRTADNMWVQVVLADGSTGWVASEYLVVNIDLNVLSVTGTVQNAPTAVAVVGPGGIDVVSGVSSNSRQIFLDGRAKGNLPHAFTRVGDSITASPNFLTPIGQGSYNLGAYGYLGGAIGFFSGPNGRGANPFVASSMAARNGWSTESVLNPANADSNLCQAGETPLECEYRVVKPAVALIMFGTNDSGGMPSATFQANLQAIVQISINRGVIPVLSTIPPKHYNPATDGRVAEFNQIIVATARGYDIPLWNYWQAMSVLPGEGLASDGVHPSSASDGLNAVFDAQHLQYGFPVRNLTALQMLYTLWQQVLYDGDQAPAATAPPAVVQPTQSGTGGAECLGVPPPRLTVGGQGRVTPGVPNKMRSAPSTGAAQVGSIPGEGVFSVVGGSQCADGFLWWQVSYDGVVGWTASGTSDEYWVEPYP